MIVQAADQLIARIDADPALKEAFSEGKMLGVMIVRHPDGSIGCLNAFSGNVGGRSVIEGFVPPIFDLLEPDGHFKREEKEISEINDKILNNAPGADLLKAERKRRSTALQNWIFDNYIVSNALGERKSIREVFALRGIVPPGGTGECAAPKLLNYAYAHGLQPLAMGEFWYGRSPEREVRHHGQFYPSCMGKCGPLLPWMMQGLNVEDNPLEAGTPPPHIIYMDDDIIVADKASGVLSVPGRTAAKSLQEQLRDRYGEIYSCHRLDMDTSGLIVFARSMDAKVHIESQFAAHEVRKSYIARLCAAEKPVPPRGRIELPLSPDYYDRPRQIVDFENGKSAVTEFETIAVNADGTVDVRYTPHTGRTHQLRVHSAHTLGLGRPILGDRLYGGLHRTDERLHLHAATLSLHHPRTNDILEFSSAPEWIKTDRHD